MPDKHSIIRDIKRIPVDQLFDYIVDGLVTFDELRETGKLVHDRQAALKQKLSDWEKEKRKEDDAWRQAMSQNSLQGYQSYLSKYSTGKYVTEAQQRIQQLKVQSVQKKDRIIQSILHNRMETTRSEIIGYLEEGIITDDDLINHGVFTEKALNNLKNPPFYLQENIYGWSDLPSLETNRTDLYFFGVVSSGKSSLLAGLLAYADKRGILRLQANNHIGFKYGSDLINSVRIGYTPPSTPTEGVNYISLEMYNSNEEPHPLNIIEMSGEYFNSTYEASNTDGEKSIGANKYLKNDNRKLIFLVVDYYQSDPTRDLAYQANQSAKLAMTLELLENDGTLKKVDGIFIILTKSDLLPNGASDEAGAVSFIDSHYKGLRNNLKRLQKKYQFNAKIFPFSLGDFFNKDTFEYVPETSQEIVEEIISTTFRNNGGRGGGWGRWRRR